MGWPIVRTVVQEKEIFEILSHALAECCIFGSGVPFELGHDALKVSEVRREFLGSLFEHCKLSFNSFLGVWVIVGTVEDVSEFLDGVKVDSVVDDIGVDYPVGVALEE